MPCALAFQILAPLAASASAFDQPVVTQVSPVSGPVAGGTAVTVTGTGFTTATAVSFGTTPAASFTVSSDSQLTATSPPGTGTGTVDITVTSIDGTSTTSPADQFSYLPAPTVTQASPSAGPASGRTTVTITGTGFTTATAVSFGTTPAARFTVVSDTKITTWSPKQAAGQVDVTVTSADGTSATSSADQFTYAPIPVVTQLAPSSGSIPGGTVVTISGSGFTGATQVWFGATQASSFTVVSDTQIRVKSPAQEQPGVVDVSVSAVGGVSQLTTADEFTYAQTPAVTGSAPATGPSGGDTTVTITGTGFTGVTAVTFGSVPAASFTVTSSTQITAVSPPGSIGKVSITVTGPGGTSKASSAAKFSYQGPPVIETISPASGPAGGNTTVTITGTGFTDVTAVTFGSIPAASFTVTSSIQITAVSPPGTPGKVYLTVTGPGGTSKAPGVAKFTYLGPLAVKTVSPASGPAGGNTTVTITGTGFTDVTAVTFGSIPAASFTVTSSTQITAVSPPGTPGKVYLTVTAADGTSAPDAAAKFTYQRG